MHNGAKKVSVISTAISLLIIIILTIFQLDTWNSFPSSLWTQGAHLLNLLFSASSVPLNLSDSLNAVLKIAQATVTNHSVSNGNAPGPQLHMSDTSIAEPRLSLDGSFVCQLDGASDIGSSHFSWCLHYCLKVIPINPAILSCHYATEFLSLFQGDTFCMNI